MLHDVAVAAATSTIRDVPTCLAIWRDEGIAHDSVATFDNFSAVPKSMLTTRLGALGVDGRPRLCEALTAMADC